MLPLLYAYAAPGPAPSAACTADASVASVTSQLFKRRNAPDHYVITATITNVGTQSQTPDITQHVELVRNGVVLAPQTIPALGAGVMYKVAFAVDRPKSERSEPLKITIRYVLESGDATHNACNRANDELTKTF